MVRKLLQKWKQGQSKLQTSYVRKYPKNKDDFDNYQNWELNFRSWKTGKVMEKVMEFEKLLRVRTLNSDIALSVCLIGMFSVENRKKEDVTDKWNFLPWSLILCKPICFLLRNMSNTFVASILLFQV